MSIVVLKFKGFFFFLKGQVLMKSFILKGKADSNPFNAKGNPALQIEGLGRKKVMEMNPN